MIIFFNWTVNAQNVNMSWDVRILILFLEEEMKRKLASLLLCGALSLSVLTGCGGVYGNIKIQ